MLSIPPKLVALVESFLMTCEDLRGAKEYQKALLDSQDPNVFGPEIIATAFLNEFKPENHIIHETVTQLASKTGTVKQVVPLETGFRQVLDRCNEGTCKKSVFLVCVYWAKKRGLLRQTTINTGLIPGQEGGDERTEDWQEQELINRIERFDYEKGKE